MSADEIKKTPDAEAAAEPEKTEAAAADKAEAAEKKPAAKKPAAKKAAKADAGAKADEPKAEKAPAKKKPAAKKAEPAKAADEKAAKPAAKKPAAKKVAPAKAAKPAAKKAAVKVKAEEPKAERPPKPVYAAKDVAEVRKGAAGVATFVDAAGKEVETRKLAEDRFGVRRRRQHAAPGGARRAGRAPLRHRVDQDARRGQRLHRQALPAEGHRPRPRGQRQVADPHRRRHHLRPASAQLRHQDQQEGHPQGALHGAERAGGHTAACSWPPASSWPSRARAPSSSSW